ncbi:hypothetical protein BH11PLA1_BH11PLA1_05100 [soil metagenome]
MIRACLTAALAISAFAGTTMAQTVLFNNNDGNSTGSCAVPSSIPGIRSAGLVGTGAAAGGTGISQIPASTPTQATTLGATSLIPLTGTTGFALADDFSVPNGVTWAISTIKTYAYRTGSGTGSSGLTNAVLQVFSGVPGAGGVSVYGDLTTLMPIGGTVTQAWTGIYRTGNGIVNDANRPVWEFTVPTAGLSLTAGSYWVAYAFTGPACFTPPTVPFRATDNGRQATNARSTPTWAPVFDGGAPTLPLGFPFIVSGTETGTVTAPTPVATIVPVDGSLVTASSAINPGETKFFQVTVPAIAAAANTALDITTFGSDDGTGNMNTAVALYCADGKLVANGSDNDSGPSLIAQLSFGKGLRNYNANGFGSGNNFNGQNGVTLSAGTYYIGVTSSGQSTFSGGFGSAVTGGTTGTVQVGVRYISAVSPVVPVPATAIDAGTLTDLSASGSASVVTTSLAAFELKWIKFTIPAGFSDVTKTTGHLAIDTEGSSLAPANSTALGLFKADGTRAANPGAPSGRNGGTDDLSALSYGTFNGAIPKPTNAVSQGIYFNGRSYPAAPNGSPITPGDYYIAVIGNQTLGALGQSLFDVTPRNAANAGSLTVRIRYYSNPPAASPPTLDATLSLTDGVRASTAAIPVVKGGIVWVKFNVPESILPIGIPGQNAALDIDLETSNITYTNGGVARATVFLFDANGTRTAANPTMADDFNSSGVYGALSYGPGARSYVKAQSRMNGFSIGTGVLSPGDYYACINPFDGTNGGLTGTTNWDANSFAKVAVGPSTGTMNVTFYSNATHLVPVVTSPILDQNVGAVSIAGSPYVLNQTPAFDIGPRDVRWFTFTTAALTNEGTDFLDIDTQGYGGTVPILGLYTDTGVFVAGNQANGTTFTQSGLYFGSTSTTGRTTVTGAPNTFAASAPLAAGTYWLAFSRWDTVNPATFSFGTDSWSLTTNHNFVAFPIVINVRTNQATPPTPRCQPADIADDAGNPLPSAGPNNGVNEGDYNAFFNNFFTNQAVGSPADIADDAGNPLPPFNITPPGPNSGVNEGDYNAFFNNFFNGCPV